MRELVQNVGQVQGCQGWQDPVHGVQALRDLLDRVDACR